MGSLKGRRVQVAGDPLSPSATRLAPVVAAFAVGLLNALQSRMNGGLATAGILRVEQCAHSKPQNTYSVDTTTALWATLHTGLDFSLQPKSPTGARHN